MPFILREDIEVFWKHIHNIQSFIDQGFLDEAFLKLLNDLYSDIRIYSHPALSQSLFRILLQMCQNEQLKTLAFGLLRKPFGLVSRENRVEFVKSSMALTNSLPFEHYSQVVKCYFERLSQDSSFLVVSEDWGKIRQGMEVLASLGRPLPQLNLELANAGEGDSDIFGIIPASYSEFLISQGCWKDPLLRKLVQIRQDVFDCVYLSALIQYKNTGTLSEDLIFLLKNAPKTFFQCLLVELIKINPALRHINDNFISAYRLSLDL
jgi:hypothetical protein